MKLHYTVLSVLFISCQSLKPEEVKEDKPIRFITVDPGHFHAALVQKSMYPDVDSTVHVYAPAGPDIEMHLNRIEVFNSRAENPTKWNEEVYTGDDFFQKMIDEKAGNVAVLAGNNQRKTEYIKRSLQAGFHVLADKPMAIDSAGFNDLKEAFSIAEKNGLLLYDIMTERYEIATMLQRDFSMSQPVFGSLQNGSIENPAVTKESIHHFYKFVSGSVLTRPAWFMDTAQQGDGIVDVTTHLVDLIQWGCFPEQIINYSEDVKINSAAHWPTPMTLHQFSIITKNERFPEYLKKDLLNDTTLNIYGNGEINYRIKGVHAKVSVIWNYKAPEGGGDTHHSVMRGSKASLIIRQGMDTEFKPDLFIEPLTNDPAYEKAFLEEFEKMERKYPGITFAKNAKGWKVQIPDSYRTGHEAHFAEVTKKFLEYLTNKNMPPWEVPNMIAKYYTTTQALKIIVNQGRENK
jgi:predicted dehydrogenase